ncbi:hypothetical protein D3C74_375140 [compost metagenome]
MGSRLRWISVINKIRKPSNPGGKASRTISSAIILCLKAAANIIDPKMQSARTAAAAMAVIQAVTITSSAQVRLQFPTTLAMQAAGQT